MIFMDKSTSENKDGASGLKKFRCTVCGYIYDEALEKIKFSDLPDDWQCPVCGVPKTEFEEV